MRPARRFGLVAVVILAAFPAGCATQAGNSKTEDVGAYMKLQKDVTTKQEVHGLFGQPARVKYLEEPAGSTCEHIYVKAGVSAISLIPVVGLVAGGVNSDYKVGRLYFNKDDRYVNLETESASKYTSHWVGISKGVVDTALDQNADLVQAEMQKYRLPFDAKAAKELRGIGTYMKED